MTQKHKPNSGATKYSYASMCVCVCVCVWVIEGNKVSNVVTSTVNLWYHSNHTDQD